MIFRGITFTRLALLSLFFILSANCYASSRHISRYIPVQQFIDTMVNQYHFDKNNLDRIFDDVQFRPDVIASMNKPAESLTWDRYRNIFFTEKRLRLGVQFWHAHAKTLALAQKRYGVPANMIVAIIGIETFYGGNTGSYRVIDTLSTLSFEYPSRQKFFQYQLAEYLLLTRDLGLDPLQLRGSYAGAMGLPQFMPSNFRLYAVSLRNDWRIDLLDNPDNAILSVANFLKHYGWQTGQPVAVLARTPKTATVNVEQKFSKPTTTLAKFASRGIYPTRHYSKQKLATLIQLTGTQPPEYWLVFPNFYTITRYNKEVSYAMVAYQFSQALAQQMKIDEKKRPPTST
jgi:membrane-bound lytic murein transglycosylase B